MTKKDLKKIEQDLIKPKSWEHFGEVDKTKRPVNSLLSKQDLSYAVTDKIEPISVKQNNEILKLTLQRLREGTFDNYNFEFITEFDQEEEKVEEEEENVEDIELLYNEIEGLLLGISDFGRFGYMPDTKFVVKKKVEIKSNKKNVKSLQNIKNVTVLQNK